MIAFIYQNTANLVFDCFGNSAMAGREDRQSACHRFQHGIGNAFLISIAARFARMQKNLRRVKKIAQFFLRDEAREIDSANDFAGLRSGEHTTELQAPSHRVCRLLLETKKNADAKVAASPCKPCCRPGAQATD